MPDYTNYRILTIYPFNMFNERHVHQNCSCTGCKTNFGYIRATYDEDEIMCKMFENYHSITFNEYLDACSIILNIPRVELFIDNLSAEYYNLPICSIILEYNFDDVYLRLIKIPVVHDYIESGISVATAA